MNVAFLRWPPLLILRLWILNTGNWSFPHKITIKMIWCNYSQTLLKTQNFLTVSQTLGALWSHHKLWLLWIQCSHTQNSRDKLLSNSQRIKWNLLIIDVSCTHIREFIQLCSPPWACLEPPNMFIVGEFICLLQPFFKQHIYVLVLRGTCILSSHWRKHCHMKYNIARERNIVQCHAQSFSSEYSVNSIWLYMIINIIIFVNNIWFLKQLLSFFFINLISSFQLPTVIELCNFSPLGLQMPPLNLPLPPSLFSRLYS